MRKQTPLVFALLVSSASSFFTLPRLIICQARRLVATSAKKTATTNISKGFGALKTKPVEWDGVPLEDDETVSFFKYLRENGADCSKVCLASFGGLRGVMALTDIRPGEAIMAIPYELCLDLGPGTDDPTLPALVFHGNFKESNSKSRPYLNKIPTVDSGDCTTTDFFTAQEVRRVLFYSCFCCTPLLLAYFCFLRRLVFLIHAVFCLFCRFTCALSLKHTPKA